MSVYPSANIEPLVSREQVGEAIRKALALYVGRGRRYSVKELSNGTGIKDRVIECALCAPTSEHYRPLPLEALTTLELFLGPDFTAARLSLAGQGAFLLPNAGAIDPHALAADNADDNATVTRAALDGEFDADEILILPEVGTRMMTRGAILASLRQ
ncbi:hypothetical protein [Sphingomonas abietis]|uniref:Uncharacterized protein n=1 Tax=Sphingomonas abietis TaxID=3012344 RepID=A0ABY7NR01_9SPHN|nr:hypothetical protein [Sphingomonas abietis]WBO23966.1 hypothetical protein PBT88_07605 [Sphingomonas abietis]